ncbi:MAG: acyl-CoA dehydratase activase [Desulfobacterales bacterium]
MITAGIDCGTQNTKTVILKDGKIACKAKVLTGFDLEKAVENSLNKAVRTAGIVRQDIRRICGTGSGKDSIKMADADVNDIQAMSKGAHFFFPTARTVIDVGAEEGRAAKIDEKGGPVDFAVNEKCAAGAGAFIESMARALEVAIEQMGPLSLKSDKKIPMNAQCVIFAESEVVALIHAGTAKSDICKAIHDSMAGRIVSMVRRIGVNRDIVMLGGVGYNVGFVAAMKRELKIDNILVPDSPEYGSALGAAFLAAEES